jgi:hypothetical protein
MLIIPAFWQKKIQSAKYDVGMILMVSRRLNQGDSLYMVELWTKYRVNLGKIIQTCIKKDWFDSGTFGSKYSMSLYQSN